MAQKLQIAFQGGGAKVFALIAAIQAIKEIQADKGIEITRVIGSSAGAIAASLLASGVDIKYIRKLFSELPQELSQPDFSSIKIPNKFWSIEFIIFWHKLLKNDSVKSVREGRPIINENILRNKLNSISELKDKKIKDFSNPSLLITTSDLRYGEQKLMKENDRVIDSILDSCRIPFIIGGNSISSSSYDGGITGNLPISHLTKDINTHGPILAFTFKEYNGQEISNKWELLLRTVFSALESNVHLQLDHPNIYTIELNARDVDTLHFKRMAKILDENDLESEPIYELTYKDTKTKLLNFLNEITNSIEITENNDPIIDTNRESDRRIQSLRNKLSIAKSITAIGIGLYEFTEQKPISFYDNFLNEKKGDLTLYFLDPDGQEIEKLSKIKGRDLKKTIEQNLQILSKSIYSCYKKNHEILDRVKIYYYDHSLKLNCIFIDEKALFCQYYGVGFSRGTDAPSLEIIKNENSYIFDWYWKQIQYVKNESKTRRIKFLDILEQNQ